MGFDQNDMSKFETQMTHFAAINTSLIHLSSKLNISEEVVEEDLEIDEDMDLDEPKLSRLYTSEQSMGLQLNKMSSIKR